MSTREEYTYEQWKRDLLSGRYARGRSALEDQGKFCCLGVLAKECGISTVIEFEDEDGGRASHIKAFIHPDEIDNAGPRWFKEWEWERRIFDLQSRLSFLNDSGEDNVLFQEDLGRYRTIYDGVVRSVPAVWTPDFLEKLDQLFQWRPEEG